MEIEERLFKDELFRSNVRNIETMSNALRGMIAGVIRDRIQYVGKETSIGGKEGLAVEMEDSDVFTEVYLGDGRFMEETIDGLFMEKDGLLSYIMDGALRDDYITLMDMLKFLVSHDNYEAYKPSEGGQ